MKRLRQSAEWRFLAVMPRAAPRLAALWWALIAASALLPAVFAVTMGALASSVEAGRSLTTPLAVAGGVFLAMNALAPVHEVAGSNLGDRVADWLHDKLARACVDPPGLAHLERRDLADDLTVARDFDLGISSPPLRASIAQIGSGFGTMGAGLVQTLLLAGYRWWAPVVIGGAWISTHILLRDASVWKAWTDENVVAEQRHVDYAYKLAVEQPAAKELRMFGLSDWVVDRYTTKRGRMVDALSEARRLRLGPMRWGVLAVVGANGLLFWSLARDATAGTISLGALVVFVQAAVGAALLAFGEADWWFRQSAQPIPKVLDLAERMRAAGALSTSGGREADGRPAQEIRFSGVSFAYPTSPAPVLEGFDLTIPAGTSLAIVGSNGAGKTTLAKLLCRLYDPTGGAIVVDGVDLREIDPDNWRTRVAVVFQDFVRYELSLRDNVAPVGADDDVITTALDTAQAGDLAALDTILSRGYEGGTDLSGGQWQRVAIARALCAVADGADLVLLDEPTAQLDVRGEAAVFDAVLAATRGRTTILVSHRFSTVRHADRICVVEHGAVVELGTHVELMALDGRYRRMFDLQASRFYEEVDEEGVLDAVQP
jgi:ABC-type transport system involved in cytochrome bd biosynthesis fused ATPase/permease subunit